MMQGVRIDILGKKFGRLTVVSLAPTVDKRAMWNCLCDCGAKKTTSGKYLRTGRTRSCGCIRAEGVGKLNSRHAMTRTKTYVSWASMHSRCTNKNQQSYKNYGGKGVTICGRWSLFENFLEDMGKRPLGMTLDRINPFGNYCKENCKWSNAKEQSLNRRGQLAIAILERLDREGLLPDKAYTPEFARG